ncbi:hypothetical protein CK203_021949 [Vitis vinifera]|uniref:Endonuclease/exonuclease/phosphatase domain-containing protein n=1 Tax=Vitis vinifera TaxID=29760 RepID=A0A438JFG5_VITVI|nr:hypothetical protein CK203_021949 [Vitis vinifera]
MIRNQSFEVERKAFQVKFEDFNGGTWISITERSRGFVVSLGFGEEESGWLLEHLKKAVDLGLPGVLKAMGGKILGRRLFQSKILCSSERALKEKLKKPQESKGMYRGEWSYADVVAEKGPRNAIARRVGMKGMVSVTPISAYKGCFFVDSARRAQWIQDQGSFTERGEAFLSICGMRAAEIHFAEVGEVTKVARNAEACRFDEGKIVGGDASKCRASSATRGRRWRLDIQVAVTVTGEDDEAEEDSLRPESNHSKDELSKKLAAEIRGGVFSPKRNLEGGGSRRQIETLFGANLSPVKRSFSWFKTSKVFTGETEGDEGISQCKLVNKPFSSFRWSQALPFSVVPFYLSCCDLSRRGGASCSEGEASFPELEPSTLPLEGFQDNGKGVEGENKSTLSADKVYSEERGKMTLEPEERISYGCWLCRVVFVYMKILSWNTRGLGSRKKRRTVRRFLSTQNPDVVMLQETKREIWDRRFVSSVWKGRSWSGLLFLLVGLRGDCDLWDSIKFKCTEKVLGSSLRISEKMGDSRLTVNMRCFDEFIRESGLLDPPLRNAAFTWSNMQFSRGLPRWTSDHSPICLETNPLKWGPTPFRFENMWLLHPEFKEKFRDWWQECTVEGWEGHKFMRKLKFIKSKLKEWNIVAFGDLRERKKHILSELGRIDLIEQEGNLILIWYRKGP